MLKVIVESAEVRTKAGTSARTGKPYNIREQEAHVFLIDSHGVEKRFPAPVRIALEDGAPAYPPGEYDLSPASLYVGKFERLECGRIVLIPRKAAGVKAAA